MYNFPCGNNKSLTLTYLPRKALLYQDGIGTFILLS